MTVPAQDPPLLPIDPSDFERAADFGPAFVPANAEIPEEEPGEPSPTQDLDERASQDFRGLLYLGYLEEECRIAGHRFLLRTPNQDERLQMGIVHQPFLRSISSENAWRIITAAAFVRRIDSTEGPEQLNGNGNPVRDRFEWIKESIHSSVIIEKIFDHCLQLYARERALVDYLDSQGEA